MPWPPRPTVPKDDLPTDAKAPPPISLGARSAPAALRQVSAAPEPQRGLRQAPTLSE
jgi:hypothetical protein